MYDPRSYWQKRLSEHFTLRGVGHLSYGESFNTWLYRKKKHTIEKAFSGKSLTGKTVLDIGCGTGFFVRWYREHGAKVYGTDITEVSVENLSRLYHDSYFWVSDITSAAFEPPTTFDIINVWDVLYHVVDDSGFQQALKNIARSSHPGSLLLVSEQLGAPTDTQDAPHVKFRCLDTYQTLLQPLGFHPIKQYPLYHFLNQTCPEHRQLYSALAPIWYLIDSCKNTISSNNLSLGLWEMG
jgi:SAM-dependent methyltransferase